MPNEIKRVAKILPVLLLLDVSGSMSGEKIRILESSVNEMINSFANLGNVAADIHVSCITFANNRANEALSLVSAASIDGDLKFEAMGNTPLGLAVNHAQQIIDNVEIIPKSAYRPVVVLVSDGAPTDNWETSFDKFVNGRRTSKCHRMALGIGIRDNSAEHDILKKFISDEEEVFLGNADEIVNFFNYVTMSVGTRSVSVNPNVIPKKSELVDNDLEEDI